MDVERGGLHLPDSLHKQALELASQDGISIDQFAATAIAGKLSALMTSGYLEQGAARGDRGKFEQAMAKVGAAPPDEQVHGRAFFSSGS